jgi:capsular polysaccharide transport system permease protein
MAIRIKKHTPLKTFLFVLKALLKRERVTRFGKYKLGAVWMLVDPLLSVIVLGLILGPFMGRSTGSVPYPFFLLCGFMLLSLMTGPINSSANAVGANQGLLVFRQVQPFDTFVSRFVFELVTTTLAFMFFCLIGWWFGVEITFMQIFSLIYCLLVTWVTGCGLGLLLGIAAMKIKELEKIIAYIQRPLIFISAILFPISTVPPDYRGYLLLNPLVHTVEYSRSCLFPAYEVPDVNLVYPSIFGLVCLALGMMTYRNNRQFLKQL